MADSNKKTRYSRHLSIKVKLLSITITLILLSVVVVSFLSYRKYTQDFLRQSSNSTLQIIEQLSFNIDSYLSDLFRLCEAPYYYDDVMKALEQHGSSTLQQYEKRKTIEGFLAKMMITPRHDIMNAYIISDEIYHGGRYYVSIDDSVDLNSFDWYVQTETSNLPIYVPTHKEQLISNSKFMVFSVVRRINQISNTSHRLAVIKVDANFSGIESIAGKVNMGREGGLFIIDQNGIVIYENTEEITTEQVYNVAANTKQSITTEKIKNKDYVIAKTNIERSGWTVVAVNSVKELSQKFEETRNSTFLMALVCSLLSIIILLIFTNSFLRPLLEIIALTKKVKGGSLDVKFPETRKDEIGYLGASFNSMISRINSMVNEVYKSRLLQTEAQLNAFYSQIRPHFLFNTLNMISLSIRCEKYELAISNIDRLSDLLRGMTHLDKEITLKEELDILKAYLSIQTSRYPDKLSYNINIDESLYSYIIPALTFQPIVENAVVHGCENTNAKTHIEIQDYCSRGFQVFRIEDTGDGIDRETLLSINENLCNCNKDELQDHESLNKNGIGLTNVNKRLKIKYGEQYGLTIESEINKGTVVEIYLPKQDDKGG